MQNQTNKNEHKVIMELLPWLVNGSLTADESERVNIHLQSCEKCRKQVSQLQAVNKHVAEEESEWQPSSAHFSSILSEVNRLETVAPKQKKTRNKGGSGFFKNLLQTPTPVRWTLALESVVLVALLTVWTTSPQFGLQSDAEFYQTLSDSPQNKSASNMNRIRLLLNDAMTTEELTQLLQQTGAQMSQGPSALGLYIVEVPQQRAEQSLEIFRNNQNIRLAETLEVVQN